MSSFESGMIIQERAEALQCAARRILQVALSRGQHFWGEAAL
jgi:hypothetical protein